MLHDAGGVAILAHPNEPNYTSLRILTDNLEKQGEIIEQHLLTGDHRLDGIECWHSHHDPATVQFYTSFCDKKNLIKTGGTDFHQSPEHKMGSIPDIQSNLKDKIEFGLNNLN